MRCCGAVLLGLAAGVMAAATAGAQNEAFSAADIAAGHALAVKVCSVCHLAAPDQAAQPALKPPAPAFAAIMQRKDVTAASLRAFLASTHRGLDRPKGMPDPRLADFQVKQAVAYLMSLRK